MYKTNCNYLSDFHKFTRILCQVEYIGTYRKVASSNMSCLEAHAGFFRLFMKGIFDPLCTVSFWQKVDFLISNVR